MLNTRANNKRASCLHAARQIAGTESCLEIIRRMERTPGRGGYAIRARSVACDRCREALSRRQEGDLEAGALRSAERGWWSRG